MDVVRTDNHKRNTRKRIKIALSILAFLVLGWSLLSLVKPAAPEVMEDSLWYGDVKRGEMLREVRGPGILKPREIRWLASNVSGRIERILVKPGAKVLTDEILVELSNPELHQLAEEARWALDASEAKMNALKVQLESQQLDIESQLVAIEAEHEGAKLQYEAELVLAKKNIVSKIDLHRSKLKRDQNMKLMKLTKRRLARFEDSANAQIKAHQALTEQLKKSYQRRQQQVEGLQIKSSIPGIVQEVPVEEGQRVIIGANIARVARPDDLIAELLIPETQAKDIQLGLAVNVDTRNGVAKGTVARVDPRVKNGTVQVDVMFIENLPAGARPDLNVDGTITLEKLNDILFVKRPSFAESGAETTIFSVNQEASEAIRKPVVFGRSSVNHIEIIRGLKEGEKIILSDMTNWSKDDRLVLE